MPRDRSNLVWIDLETTGLSVATVSYTHLRAHET